MVKNEHNSSTVQPGTKLKERLVTDMTNVLCKELEAVTEKNYEKETRYHKISEDKDNKEESYSKNKLKKKNEEPL